MDGQWFSDPNQFGMWYGSVAGGVGGTTVGMLGWAASRLAPAGKGRSWILGALRGYFVFGLCQLLIGIVALVSGQAYAVYYPLLLCGVIFTAVIGINFRSVKLVYDAAEHRKLEAQAIRSG
jgi:hypothetical protein